MRGRDIFEMTLAEKKAKINEKSRILNKKNKKKPDPIERLKIPGTHQSLLKTPLLNSGP